MDKAGRLCEKTIELPVVLGKASCFTVTDLSADERFNELPFVTGPPRFKFYAGTPLTTKKGINIGSLFILDDTIRPHLTLEQEEFLGTMAQIIMKHMEVTSEAEERKKVMRMSMGLNAFVEGKSHFHFHADLASSISNEKPKQGMSVGLGQRSSDGANPGPVDTSRPQLHQRPLQQHPDHLHGEDQGLPVIASETLLDESPEPQTRASPRRGEHECSLKTHV